ncbi:hypothetical protein O6H91_19G073500 [Diphasiastrum complanatum]|uniref:Uncharacterized protein n=1 Tax=Diphasiastrum complanatum TaxID=34168 RepID=A0ACC2AWM7_DIPCM|nr:hypothetical protein O6H91_19G073500 [Diphasiastrum complanatum]
MAMAVAMAMVLTSSSVLVFLLWIQSVASSPDHIVTYGQQDLNLVSGKRFLWPFPASVNQGHGVASLSQEFKFVQLASDGRASDNLKSAFYRYYGIIFSQHSLHGGSSLLLDQTLVLKQLQVHVHSQNEELQLGIDESYELSVPDSEDPTAASLKTFSQLCAFNFTTRTIQVQNTPWEILDRPRFEYRGLLIDTSRHYQPLEVIRSVIDSMAYAKLNVLHWHIVDTESFPIEVPSFPDLWNGAYSNPERYTLEDAKDIVEYARLRGINVMAELDVPGHARSWGNGYPNLWPSSNCTQPLDVSNKFTFEVIDGIISDFAEVFRFKLMHLGGDEVDTTCWNVTPHIRAWLIEQNLSPFGAYEQFVLRAQKIALSHGYRPVNWEEPFDKFGSKLNNETVVHNWLGPGVAPEVVKAGYQCIVSNQDAWYLDHLDVPWETFYQNEPLAGITDTEQQKLVLGGEVCMWGESVDASDIQQTIWPRAAAAAEKLWSPLEVTKAGVSTALPRLEIFRCLLTERGIAAAPVRELGRKAPPGYGSCYEQ